MLTTNLTGDTWTAASTSSPPATGFSASGTGNINDTATLPPGSSITYTVTGTVQNLESNTLSNTATATPTVGTPVSATDTDTIGTPNLTIVKSDNEGGSTTPAPSATSSLARR